MSRTRPLAALALAILSTAVVAASCAKSEQSPTPSPPADASVDDAASDPSLDHPQDAAAEDGSYEADASDSQDAASEVQDLCAQDGALWFDAQTDASDSPCQPGEVDKAWCGQCGRRQRICNNDSTWKPWSDCFEDQAAECIPCESHPVPCGHCGTRTQSCDITQNVCRWVLGVCDATGECSPGDYEADAAGCNQGSAHLRWCQPGCAWGAPGACETPPAFAKIASAPIAGRVGAASVQTPSGWFIWGGLGAAGALADGAVFDPVGGQWTVTASATLSARSNPVALWIESAVFLWGGETGNSPNDVLGDGARWSAGVWSGVSSVNPPLPRAGASAVWDSADGDVLIWGGSSAFGNSAKGGARYHAATDMWTAIADAPMQARQGASAVWDSVHGRMIVWGGLSDGSTLPERGGASYDPATDTWTPIADAPIRRKGQVAFWDEVHGKMLVFFGEDGVWSGPRSDGAAYDPGANSWSALADASLAGYPIASGYAAVYGGGHVWVSGGLGANDGNLTARGARYDIANDAWSRLPDMTVGRTGHAAAWLGDLTVWGGQGVQGTWLASGERVSGMK